MFQMGCASRAFLKVVAFTFVAAVVNQEEFHVSSPTSS